MRRRSGIVTPSLLATVLIPALAAGQTPFTFDAAPGRLPKSVVPQRYEIAIQPDIERHRLQGHESIVLQFRAPSASIQFNSLNETLSAVRLDGRSVQAVRSDNVRQLTTVTLAAPALAGTHRLTFSYSGRIQTSPAGLYALRYQGPHGRQHLMLSTQMEATDARRLFPCWDEPAFRARFRLTVTLPAAWSAVSNTPIARREQSGTLATTTFDWTPSMPSYLVELSAGDLGHLDSSVQGIRLGAWSVAGRQQSAAAALANARQILADYNDYFGYRYPLPKLDSIAIPGGFSGAMENWGAITYQDSLLLLTSSATLVDQQQVYSTQAHEMAHQWNGDLVTMGWWDDLWLNESFASWMSAKETAQRHPDWNWWQVQDADRQGAMTADAEASSPPIEQHVIDELQASSAFDPAITYSKGQAVLRMFEAYLGPTVFRDGIRRYIRARAFSNATPGDLWSALGVASGQNIAAIVGPWTRQPGFPLVNVAAHCDARGYRHIDLSQERFLLRGRSRGRASWSVPLQMRVGSAGQFQPLLLVGDSRNIAAGRCGEPLSLDADALGFYRVKYDAATLAADTRDFSHLPDGDRIALLDDQWALAEATRATLASYLALPAAMGADLNTRAWQQVAAALGTLEFDERGTRGHDAFTTYARSIIAPVASRLGWEPRAGELPDTAELRRALLLDLGEWGDPAVTAEAHRRYQDWQRSRRDEPAGSLELILSLMALDADQPTFDQLHRFAREARDPAQQQLAYSALMLVRSPRLAGEAVRIALSNEIPPQDAQLRLSMITALSEGHPQLAWEAFSAHSQELLSPFGSLAPLIMAQYVPEWFWNSQPPLQLDSWVRARVPKELSPAIARGMQRVLFRRSEKAVLVPAADAYVRSLRSAASPQRAHPPPNAR